MDLVAAAGERIKMLGIPVEPIDDYLLKAVARRTVQCILDNAGLVVLPDTLLDAASDLTAVAFLMEKKSTGKLGDLDLSAPIKSIQEGDVGISFMVGEGNMTSEQRVDSLLRAWSDAAWRQIACHRRVPW